MQPQEQQQIPFQYVPLQRITNLQIPPQSNWSTTILTNDRFIGFNDMHTGSQILHRISLTDPTKRSQTQVNARDIIITPEYVFYTDGQSVSLMDSEMRPVRSYPLSNVIMFWKLIDQKKVLILLKDGFVMIDPKNEAIVPLCPRSDQILEVKDIGITNKSETAYVLGRMVNQQFGASIYSVKEGKSQFIPCSFIATAHFFTSVNAPSTDVIMMINMNRDSMEMKHSIIGVKDTKTLEIKCMPGEIPLFIHPIPSMGLFFLITDQFIIRLFGSLWEPKELFTINLKNIFPQHQILKFAPCSIDQHCFIMALSDFSIIKLGLNLSTLAKFLMTKDQKVLARLTLSAEFAECDVLAQKLLTDNYIKSGNQAKMVELILSSCSPYLRSASFLEFLFKACGPQMYIAYILKRLELGDLSQAETFQYVDNLIKSRIPLPQDTTMIQHVFQLMESGKLNSSLPTYLQLLPTDPKAIVAKILTITTPEMLFNELISKNMIEIAISLADEHKIKFEPTEIFARLVTAKQISQALSFLVIVRKSGRSVDLNNSFSFLFSKTVVDPMLLSGAISSIPDVDDLINPQLQTKIIEVVLMQPLAFQKLVNLFTRYDKRTLANICRSQHRYVEAFMLYDSLLDKMDLINNLSPPFDWMVEYLSEFPPDECFKCMRELMVRRPDLYRDVVINIAKEYHEHIGLRQIIGIFKESSDEALFLFLKTMHGVTSDPEIHEDYIQICLNLNRSVELHQVLSTSEHYRVEHAISILKTSKSSVDETPMVIVCSRFNRLTELVEYLDSKKRLAYLNHFLNHKQSEMMPDLVAALCDLDKSDIDIIDLMRAAPLPYSFRRLFDILFERQRLNLMQVIVDKFLNVDLSVPQEFYTVVALYYIETNQALAVKFLTENSLYSSQDVGDYCRSSHPSLALIVFSKKDEFIEEYIKTATEYQLFFDFVAFLLHKKSEPLWSRVMDQSFEFRSNLLEQMKGSSFSKMASEADLIMVLLNVLIQKGMFDDITEILNNILSSNQSSRYSVQLQELIISCSIKGKNPKLRNYINQYNDFDHKRMGTIAEAHDAFEEAVIIYRNKGLDIDVIRVLAEKLNDLDRATQYAELRNVKEGWLELARIQLDKGMVNDCMQSYLRAKEYPNFTQVIAAANKLGDVSVLMSYLEVLRLTIPNDPTVDSEYAMCLVKTGQLQQLEVFLSGKNGVNPLKLGDRCFEQELYRAARTFYTHIKNYPKLALTMLKLQLYQEAYEFAINARQPQIWREVCQSCVISGEMTIAFKCAQYLLTFSREIPILSEFYEKHGHYTEIINIFESATTKDSANSQHFTLLALLYCRYKPEKLREFIEHRWSQLRINDIISEVKTANMYYELSLLYEYQKAFDLSLKVMLDYPGVAWREKEFSSLASKVHSTELLYRSIEFYAECYPELLCDFLKAIYNRLDCLRCLNQLKKLDCVYLCKEFLQLIQNLDQQQINCALNDLYIEEYDHKSLFTSVNQYRNFDLPELAKKLESHDLVDFRRVANSLYKDSRKFKESIQLAHQDGLVKDAIQYALDSKDPAQVLDVLEYYLSEKNSDAVVALLYVCYDLVSPDIVLELCWIYQQMEYALPYFVQYMKDNERRVSSLESRLNVIEGGVSDLKETSRKTATKVTNVVNMQSTLSTPRMLVSPNMPMASQQQQPPPQMMHHPNQSIPQMHQGMPGVAVGYPPQMGAHPPGGNPYVQQQQQQQIRPNAPHGGMYQQSPGNFRPQY